MRAIDGGFRVVLILTILALSGCGMFDSSPAATVKAFYKEVEAGKLTEAMERIDSSAMQMLGQEKMKAGLARQTEEMKSKGGIKRMETKSEEVNGEVATVELLVEYGDGTSDTERERLVKGEKGWLLVPEF